MIITNVMNSEVLDELNKKLYELNKILTPKRYPFLTPLRIIAGTFITIMPTYFIFREKINNHIANEGGKIAGTIVTSSDVKMSLDELLTSKTTQKMLTDATKEWLSNKETKEMLTQVTKEWLTNDSTKEMLTQATKEWLSTPEIQEVLSDLIINTISSKQTKNALVSLAKTSAKDAFPVLKYFVSADSSEELK